MSYIEDICEPLIETLSHTAGLHTYQLAGQVENLSFWMGEVRHALEVIDGYDERFRKLLSGQQRYLAEDPNAAIRAHSSEYEKSLGVGVSEAVRTKLRRRIVTGTERFLERCLKEKLIKLAEADDFQEKSRIHRSGS